MSQDEQPDLRETLSALVDGETNEWELRRLLREAPEDIDQRWAAYQTIGTSLRGETQSGVDISAAVSEAVAAEGTKRPAWLVTARKPLAQTAVAASVAIVAMLGIQQYQMTQLEPANSSTEMAASDRKVPVRTAPVNLQQGFQASEISTRNVSSTSTTSPAQALSVQLPAFDREELRSHFERSLMEHSENAADTSPNFFPHARLPQSMSTE